MKKFFKKDLSLIFILGLLVFILGACGNGTDTGTEEEAGEEQTEEAADTADAGEEVYIGWYGPLTGAQKQYGDTLKAATEIAVEDINNNGGILDGKTLVVDYFDDQNDPNEAVTIANNIVNEDKYSAVVGSFGTAPTMAAYPIFEDAQILNYSPSASHADLTSQGDYIFRNYLTQAVECKQYADFVYNELDIKSIAILNSNDDYGNNVAELFTKEYEALGGVVTSTQSYVPGQTTDFSPLISSAKESDPEAFYPIAFYEELASILQQADSLEFDVTRVLPSNVVTQGLIDLAGESAEGAYLMSAYNPDSDSEEQIRVYEAYEEKTSQEGDLYVMLAYDTLHQTATAIDEAGTTDSVAVRDTLAGMQDYEGIAESYGMNEIGDAQRSLFPLMIEGGQFVTYK